MPYTDRIIADTIHTCASYSELPYNINTNRYQRDNQAAALLISSLAFRTCSWVLRAASLKRILRVEGWSSTLATRSVNRNSIAHTCSNLNGMWIIDNGIFVLKKMRIRIGSFGKSGSESDLSVKVDLDLHSPPPPSPTHICYC